jgi:hypothetical protein
MKKEYYRLLVSDASYIGGLVCHFLETVFSSSMQKSDYSTLEMKVPVSSEMLMPCLLNYTDNNLDTRGSGNLRSHVYFINFHVPGPNISLDIVCELRTKYIFLAVAVLGRAQ